MQNHEEKERKEEAQVLDVDRMKIIIPECCREGWPDCPHVPKRVKIAKRNVGL